MSYIAEECYIYRGWRRNQTDLIVSGYEGVPQNLLLNVIAWLIMIMAFSILRKKAWNYGRIALLERYEARWTEVFYGSCVPLEDDGSSNSSGEPATVLSELNTDGNVKEHSPEQLSNTTISNLQQNKNRRLLQERAISMDGDTLDPGLFGWVMLTFTLADEHFMRKSGPDAVQYLSFQRHLIFLASVMSTFSLLIIMPIHLQGDVMRGDNVPDVFDFRQSTIQNVQPNSKLLWIHIVLSIVFVLISILTMRHFSRSLKIVARSCTRTITINGIGVTSRRADVFEHFGECYPSFKLEEVNFAYDISKLHTIQKKMASNRRAYLYCRRHFVQTGERLKITPHCCGTRCLCRRCTQPDDAIRFYWTETERYRALYEAGRKVAFTKLTPMAFIRFKTVDMAEKVIMDYRFTVKCFSQTPRSRCSTVLESGSWNVAFAPDPSDIIWENLSQGTKTWYCKLLLVNSFVLLVTCFYSTPVFLLNTLNAYMAVKREKEPDDKAGVSGIVRDTIPTIMLWISAILIPSLVSVTDRAIGFWTKTAENRSKMIKTFTFLMFMVIILPSLGLTSFSTLIGMPVRWNCIFASTNVSFFVHYLTTSCFIGTASELMRFPELFVYMVQICFTKSIAEIVAVRKACLWDFQLGSQYAWMVLNFAIFTIFSLVAPVITPFGLLYLMMKYFVDRHNIFFAYSPCKVDKQVHGTAINLVIVCMFLLQLILLVFVSSNSTELVNKPLQAFAVIGMSITAALFVGQVFFNMCTSVSPIHYHEEGSRQNDATSWDSERGQEPNHNHNETLHCHSSQENGEIIKDPQPMADHSILEPEDMILSGTYLAPILTDAQ